MDKPAIMATFHPEAWVNDNTIEVDPEGETTFDVTDAILANLSEYINGDYDFTDELKELGPEWIQKWNGPFYIEVSNALEEYFKSQAAFVEALQQQLAQANQEIKRLNTFLPDDITVRIELGIDDEDDERE